MLTPSTNLERDILSALFEFPRDSSFTRFPWLAKADRLGSLASHDALALSFLAVAYFVSENQSSGRRLEGGEEETEKRKKGLRKRRPPRARTMPTKRDRTDDNAENDNFAYWLSLPV